MWYIIHIMKNLQQGFVGLVAAIIIGLVLVGGGTYVYLNKVFSNFFPKGWTTEEEVLSSNGCSARVYFAQNSVSKQTLINESTDYLHYLVNPGSVVSVSGGIGEIASSFENLKKILSNMEKDGRNIKLSFFQEDVEVTNQNLDISGSIPS